MREIYGEDASFYKPGGSVYVKISPTFLRFLKIENMENSADIEANTDARICMGMGKFGKFIYLYSPKQQKKFLREQKKE